MADNEDHQRWTTDAYQRCLDLPLSQSAIDVTDWGAAEAWTGNARQ
jgi:predicted secreted protein